MTSLPKPDHGVCESCVACKPRVHASDGRRNTAINCHQCEQATHSKVVAIDAILSIADMITDDKFVADQAVLNVGFCLVPSPSVDHHMGSPKLVHGVLHATTDGVGDRSKAIITCLVNYLLSNKFWKPWQGRPDCNRPNSVARDLQLCRASPLAAQGKYLIGAAIHCSPSERFSSTRPERNHRLGSGAVIAIGATRGRPVTTLRRVLNNFGPNSTLRRRYAIVR